MMNRYTTPYGRSGPRGYDSLPYRHPMHHAGMGGGTTNPCNRNMPRTARGSDCGCGCGAGCGAGQENRQADSGCRSPKRDAIPAVSSVDTSCGCGGSEHTTCTHLMDQIRAVDFALYETVLYLDVYTHSCDALETYRKLKAQSEALHAEYETTCAPLTAFGNRSNTSWDWMSKPFPWEYDAD